MRGYGADVLSALDQPDGYLFTHRLGETYKRYDNYATPALFERIAVAKASSRRAVIVAVGGGVNDNCIGLGGTHGCGLHRSADHANALQ